MITREQYLEALDIVETYHQQLKPDIKTLTPIRGWSKFRDCSTRLQHVLDQIEDGIPYLDYKEEYIENIRIEIMAKVRHCGRKTLYEFIEMRGY